MENKKFHTFIGNMLGFLHVYNFCLLTNESKNSGCFLCIQDKYKCLYIPQNLTLNDYLRDVFPAELDKYISDNMFILEAPEVFIIITLSQGTTVNLDIGRFEANEQAAKRTLSRNNYYYAIVDCDGGVIG